MRLVATVAIVALLSGVAHAEGPDPKRKIIVVEYRNGSSALPGVARRVAGAIGKQTSMTILGPDQTRAVFGQA